MFMVWKTVNKCRVFFRYIWLLPPGIFNLQTDGEELYKAGHACRLRSLVVMRLRFPVSYCGYEAPPIIICMEIISASAVDIIFDNSIPSPEDDGKDWMKWLAHVRVGFWFERHQTRRLSHASRPLLPVSLSPVRIYTAPAMHQRLPKLQTLPRKYISRYILRVSSRIIIL